MVNDVIPFDMGLVIDPSKVTYLYEDHPIPRVNDILDMISSPYLLEWANKVGRFQRKSHTVYQDEALAIGTYVHDFIHNYIMYGTLPDFNTLLDTNIRNKTKNAFQAFLRWWEIISSQDIEILMAEKSLVCKYFGGTLDLLIKINGKVYLVDFKTSKMSNYKHFMQLSAYKYLLKEVEGIDIDGGCIILMLDKNTSDFKEIGFYFNKEEAVEFMDQCEEAFLSLVHTYYYVMRVQYTFDHISLKE